MNARSITGKEREAKAMRASPTPAWSNPLACKRFALCPILNGVGQLGRKQTSGGCRGRKRGAGHSLAGDRVGLCVPY